MTALSENCARGRGGKRVVEAVIDLVRDEADALAFRRRDQRGQIVRAHHRAGRIGRACDQHAFQRRAAVRGEQRIHGERPARVGRNLDHHRLAAERGEDMPVRRIARTRDRDAIARLEQREEREDESGRRAGGHHHALGLDRDAVGIGVMPRDPVAQRRHAERRRVADVAQIERGLCGLARDARRGRGRLADLHVHDAPALRLDARGGRHHVHHHERRHVAARRGSEQVTCLVEHRVFRIFPCRPSGCPASLAPQSAAFCVIGAAKRDSAAR